MRVCMYTKPKIDMIIPTSPGKGMPLNIKPQLEKVNGISLIIVRNCVSEIIII